MKKYNYIFANNLITRNLKFMILWTISTLFFSSAFVNHASASTTTSNTRWLEWVSYTSRLNWWADEKWRLTARTEYQKILEAAKKYEWTEESEPTDAEKKKKTATDYILWLFAGEFKVDRVIRWKWANALRWPNQYRIQKTKILVHHTADNNNSLPQTVAEEKEYMKTLYRYHAFSRGRWDIGYNFIIMPSGRIYEWRAGGAWVIWAHATWNNTPSVWISLVWNFEEKDPTQDQVNALTTLATSVSKKYNINPTAQSYFFKASSTFPYIKAEKHQSIAWHKDAWQTACPGKNLYALLWDITATVADRLAWGESTVATSPIVVNSSNLSELKAAYTTQYWFTPSKASIKRLEGAPKVNDIATVIKKPISVLLYDASTSLEERSLTCSQACTVRINGTVRTANTVKIQKSWKQFSVTLWTKKLLSSKFAVSTNGIITMTNYNRVSWSVKLNTFKQALLFAYWPVKRINQEPADQHHVINVVSLDTYMKWIGEASDTQSQTKANVLALLSKGYILYYAGWTIRHPSLPAGALYVITDDPRISQKYNGAGRENVWKKWTIALEQTKWTYVAYNSVLPILPYYHCSAWFTWSAAEKRWWTDTPYLKSVVDSEWACGWDFEWHGVWLSGNGASKMADEGKSVKEILEYYYPGVELISR